MAEVMAEANENQIHINNVRIAYAQGVHTARAAKPGDAEKFGAAFLMEPGHPALKIISDKVTEVAKKKWPDKWQDMLKELKAADRLPVHNGDAKASSAGYKGNFYMNAGNLIRPTVVDQNRNPLTMASGKPYSGCYVNAIVEIWAQQNMHGKRVNASLLGVQFVRDGERLAGGSVASADDFEAIPTEEGEEGSNEQADPSSLFS